MRILLGLGTALLCGCGGTSGELDAGTIDSDADNVLIDAGNPDGGPGDAGARTSTCRCTTGLRSNGPIPGFQLFCGPGQVTLAGAQTWFGPGTDLLPGGSLNGGCPAGVTSGGEGGPAGCCLDADAGL